MLSRINDCSPRVEDSAPDPAIHGQEAIDGPKSHIFVIRALGTRRKLIVHEHQKRGEPLEMDQQVQCGERHRSWFLNCANHHHTTISRH
jgi:hypothetical protein